MRAGTRASILELHWPLIALALCLAGLGVYNLHSSAAARAPDLYLTQLSWLGVAVCVATVLMFFDYRLTETLAYAVYGVVCLLLVAVLVEGKTAGGAQRWIRIGPMTVQPSEFAKLATVFCLARYFGQRAEHGSYSIGALFRLLNPSRPLVLLAALAMKWDKPLLADPVGEVARAVRGKLGTTAPSIGELWWFRALLIVTLAVALAGAITWILRTEQARALLDPWPPGRRKRLIILCCALCASLLVAVALAWHHPVVRDPFGVALATLYAGAAPGGQWATVQSDMTLRLILVGLASVYLLVSLLSLRTGVQSWSDVVVAPIDLLALPALLVLVEPDLGTAGVIVLVGMSMILVVGVKPRSLLILGLLGALVAGVGWFGILKDYQKRRILTFIDPEHDVMGAGWNAVQSLIAVGSGRWFGKGHREGTQTQLSFLPEQHTDFAFSVWAEEQGFVGCLVVLGVCLLLLVAVLAVAAEAREAYGALLATGVAAIVFWQAFINVGMVIGMLPVVGLTLPLFSYGGSSVLTVAVGLGLVLNVHWRRRSH